MYLYRQLDSSQTEHTWIHKPEAGDSLLLNCPHPVLSKNPVSSGLEYYMNEIKNTFFGFHLSVFMRFLFSTVVNCSHDCTVFHCVNKQHYPMVFWFISSLGTVLPQLFSKWVFVHIAIYFLLGIRLQDHSTCTIYLLTATQKLSRVSYILDNISYNLNENGGSNIDLNT